jgi:hypothetical protein
MRGKVTLATVAAGGIALLPMGAASSATLPKVEAQIEYNFSYLGRHVTCTVYGFSQMQTDDNGTSTSFRYGTQMVDPDPQCADALIGVRAQLAYERTADSGTEVSTSESDSNSTQGALALSSPVVRAFGTHAATFACDDFGTCFTGTFFTGTK